MLFLLGRPLKDNILKIKIKKKTLAKYIACRAGMPGRLKSNIKYIK